MKYVLALFACLFLTAASASAQVDYYIANSAAPGCGEATATGYTGQSELGSFSISGARPTTSGTKPVLSDLVTLSRVNKCSVILLQDFLTGQVIPTLTLTEVKRTGGPAGPVNTTIMTITLQNVLVDAYTLAQSSLGQPTSEQVSYKYEKATIVAHAVDPVTGAVSPAATTLIYDWDRDIVTLR